MPEDIGKQYAERLDERVVSELRKTFEAIAKLALQGSAEAAVSFHEYHRQGKEGPHPNHARLLTTQCGV